MVDRFNILNNIIINSFPKTGANWICDEIDKNCGYSFKTGGSLKIHKTIKRIHSLKKIPGEINIFRDPRDVYLSYYFYHKEPIYDNHNIKEINNFKKYIQKYHLRNFDEEFSTFIKIIENKEMYPFFSLNDFFQIKRNNFYVTYEGMNLDPKKTIKKIFVYLNFKSEGIINPQEKYFPEINSKENKTKLRTGKVGNWKNFLNDTHQKFFIDNYHDYINFFNYR